MDKKLSPWRIKQAELNERATKAKKGETLFDSKKRQVMKGIYTKGITYRKKEHGPLKVK